MDETTDSEEWTRVETTLDDDLAAVTHTAEGTYAVGDDGVLVTDGTGGSDGGNEDEGAGDDNWHIVIDAGPAGQDNNLTSLAVTDDGTRLWFAGESGALGSYDVETGKKYDYTGPKGRTTTLTSIAVTGDAGSERVHVGNDSGEVLTASVDGHEITWERVAEPGSGATITSCTAIADASYAVDGDGNAFRERDEGNKRHATSAGKARTGETAGKAAEGNDAWTPIGVESADEVFHDAVATEGQLLAAGNEGRVFRYDPTAGNWTPLTVTDATIEAIDLAGETIVAVDQSKCIHQRTTGDEVWQHHILPMEQQPTDLAVGDRDHVVGGSGAVVRRDSGTAADGADVRADGGAITAALWGRKPVFEQRHRRSKVIADRNKE